MKHLAFILCGFLLFTNVLAQTNTKKNSLATSQNNIEIRPGEEVPDVRVKPMGQAPFNLSSLRGKLVILDFFGIHCSSCITHLPDMQRFQEQFSDQIKILVVTKDDSTSVKKLLSRIPRLKNITLPFITNDSLLSDYFYYASLPTHVWIDSAGVVIQKTSGYNTSYANIDAWLAGKRINLPAMKEFRDYQRGVPLFAEGGGRQIEKLQYYSLIMGSPDGLDGQSDIHEDKDSATGKIVRLLIAQETLLRLYQHAFMGSDLSKSFVFERGRVLLEVKHPERFEEPEEDSLLDAWKDQYMCSYEIKVPPERSDKIYKWMQSDLERYYGYTAAIEDRKVACWVLKAAGNFKRSTSKALAKWEEGSNYIHATNINLYFLLSQLRYTKAFFKAPFVSEIDGVERIDLNLNCTIEDTEKLKKELLKSGLLLVKEERLLPMLIISEK